MEQHVRVKAMLLAILVNKYSRPRYAAPFEPVVCAFFEK